MDYGPFGLIKAVLETLGDSINPEQRKKIGEYFRDSKTSSFSPEALAEAREMAENDPGEQYWKELFLEMLEEAERESEIVSEMTIEDYESRHTAEVLAEDENCGEDGGIQEGDSSTSGNEDVSGGDGCTDSGDCPSYIG